MEKFKNIFKNSNTSYETIFGIDTQKEITKKIIAKSTILFGITISLVLALSYAITLVPELLFAYYKFLSMGIFENNIYIGAIIWTFIGIIAYLVIVFGYAKRSLVILNIFYVFLVLGEASLIPYLFLLMQHIGEMNNILWMLIIPTASIFLFGLLGYFEVFDIRQIRFLSWILLIPTLIIAILSLFIYKSNTINMILTILLFAFYAFTIIGTIQEIHAWPLMAVSMKEYSQYEENGFLNNTEKEKVEKAVLLRFTILYSTFLVVVFIRIMWLVAKMILSSKR